MGRENMNINKSNKILSVILVLVLCLVSFVGCSKDNAENAPSDDHKGKEIIVFADPGWDTTSFFNGIARFIIENGYGYKTDTKNGSDAILFSALRNGEVDLHMEIWKHGYTPYKEGVESGDVIEVGMIHNDAVQGYYVPTFVIKGDPERGIEPMAPDLKSVKDLAKYWKLFKDPEDKSKGHIYSSPVGWLADEITQAKVKNYGLDKTFNVFNPGSQSALEISLSKACEQGKPWVGYYWEPTWIAGKYDLTLLEDEPYSKEVYDEGKCAYPLEEIIIAGHNSFSKKAPEIYEFLKEYQLSGELVSKTLAYMQDNKVGGDEAAVTFLKENEDMWSQWVPEDVSAKVKAALK